MPDMVHGNPTTSPLPPAEDSFNRFVQLHGQLQHGKLHRIVLAQVMLQEGLQAPVPPFDACLQHVAFLLHSSLALID